MHPETNSRFAILLDGPVERTERLAGQMAGRHVIAADGGIRHAPILEVEPALWVGDFDSADADFMVEYFMVPREAHPADKAVSDGQMATERALALGATDILLCGLTGGPRTDHVFFNMSALVALAHRDGVTAFADNGIEECHPVLPGCELTPDLPENATVSLYGFTALDGVTIRGAKWPLDNVSVPFGDTLTLSNVVHAGFSVSVRSGVAVLIVQAGDGAGALLD